jgi:uncharacterized Zn-finger protein
MVTVDSSGASRFACIECNKSFAQKSYIKEHMKIHTGKLTHTWEGVCNVKFSAEGELEI